MPTIPAQAPKIKYRVPISLWLVENSQRVIITGKVAEQAADCSPEDGGLSPPLAKPWGVSTCGCKPQEAE